MARNFNRLQMTSASENRPVSNLPATEARRAVRCSQLGSWQVRFLLRRLM